MHRIVYIAGRYRHYNPDGSMNLVAMKHEVLDELVWAGVVARAGFAWIAPLMNSVGLEGQIGQDDFISRDSAIISRLIGGHDCILMRSGWDAEIDAFNPASRGATSEYEAATDQGLIVLHGMHGADRVVDYLRALEGGAG